MELDLAHRSDLDRSGVTAAADFADETIGQSDAST